MIAFVYFPSWALDASNRDRERNLTISQPILRPLSGILLVTLSTQYYLTLVAPFHPLTPPISTSYFFTISELPYHTTVAIPKNALNTLHTSAT